METFSPLLELVDNPQFSSHKSATIANLSDDMIDRPIVELIRDLNNLPYCFTLQCCYGHFVHDDQLDPTNLEPLPGQDPGWSIQYRIAYIALCIDKSPAGQSLFDAIESMAQINPQYIQFCCADWFWQRQVNSYVLQVEPERFKQWDTAEIDWNEARDIERIRDQLFVRLAQLITGLPGQG